VTAAFAAAWALSIGLPAGLAVPATHPGTRQAAEPEADLPLPPVPPSDLPADVAAPVPNVDLSAPPGPRREGTEVRPTLNQALPSYPGADPIPGTLYRSDLEQRRQFIPSPGVRVTVPLEK
jgi:hypothetical protein